MDRILAGRQLNIKRMIPNGLFYAVSKRALDIFLASIALILVSPILLITAILIKFDSKGPVFYINYRYGYKGKKFKFYKFRSLTITEEAMKKHRSDKTVTKVGKIIRKYFIDELPQLLNILKGDLSLVGPRPEQAFLVEENYEIYKKRFSVKPGLTGLWQINGKKQPIFKNINYDLEYIKKKSFIFDLKIILKTIPLVFKGDKW